MTEAAQVRAKRLLDVLDLENIETNLFLGQNEITESNRLFGGQVLAQSAVAAYRTVENLELHSLHGYFLRAGRPGLPVLYEIERIRDGRSFTTRRVVAVQDGEAIFNMDVSFQVSEPGFEHVQPMPNVPLPDELSDDVEAAEGLGETLDNGRYSPMAKIARPFETRSVFSLDGPDWARNRSWNPVWIRFREPVDQADQNLARSLLAYASDMSLVSTATLPHADEVARSDVQMASLDHALWIHRDIPVNDWILFHKRTSTAQGARGLVHSEFYASNGTMLASGTQEGLIRNRIRNRNDPAP